MVSKRSQTFLRTPHGRMLLLLRKRSCFLYLRSTALRHASSTLTPSARAPSYPPGDLSPSGNYETAKQPLALMTGEAQRHASCRGALPHTSCVRTCIHHSDLFACYRALD
ncbi:hypothetical protein BD414DRAFT_290876 [Trametes punicea]|nr:hypothetical protein BD414DRAFT_290876 [Trametes punicea]